MFERCLYDNILIWDYLLLFLSLLLAFSIFYNVKNPTEVHYSS